MGPVVSHLDGIVCALPKVIQSAEGHWSRSWVTPHSHLVSSGISRAHLARYFLVGTTPVCSWLRVDHVFQSSWISDVIVGPNGVTKWGVDGYEVHEPFLGIESMWWWLIVHEHGVFV